MCNVPKQMSFVKVSNTFCKMNFSMVFPAFLVGILSFLSTYAADVASLGYASSAKSPSTRGDVLLKN